jgi:hypothetical protein
MEATWDGEAAQLKLRQYVIDAYRTKDRALTVCKELVTKAIEERSKLRKEAGWKFWLASRILDGQTDADHEVTMAKIRASSREREVLALKQILFMISMSPTHLTLSEWQLELIHETLA